MDEPLNEFVADELSADAEGAVGLDPTVVENASAQYLGRWNRLVSTTNWEKGRIISEWRQELLSAGAPIEAASDEAWSRRVGNVSPQHVGRLRRVYQRFGEIHPQFAGLYWSHFQAALDWHDAEMWLEGAVQSNWSIAQMRTERWQATGAPESQMPADEDVAAAETDEDAAAADDRPAESFESSLREVQDPEDDHHTGPAAIDADEAPHDDAQEVPFDVPGDAEPVRPFENLPTLPHDLADAFETFKLAILNHKLAGWRDVTADDILTVLNALKELTLAPSA